MDQLSEQPTGEIFDSLEDVPRRVRDIATLRGLGYTFREIADCLGISPQAVSLMLVRHRRALKGLQGAVAMSKLSARAVNALARHGITQPSDPRLPEALDAMRHERNCGAKTISEIRRWMRPLA